MADPIVRIKHGQIKGTTDVDLDGEKFYKFMDIPYAKPPIGSLRFKAPQPPDSWNDVRDCTKLISGGCICYETRSKTYVGSEDCLYLNVYTKQLPTSNSTPKPVLVFIHGGGFILGSSSETIHGPKHLLTEDIVLVVFSYRTGVFGFLSTDDPSLDIPGNAGLKDQTAALKWVQANISNFNGDKNNVTIFGISAGSASISFQVLSPSAKGLFHKAIAQSGTALCSWAWGQKNSIKIAEKLGKKVSTEKESLEVLMNATSEEVLKASLELPDPVLDAPRRRPFGPVIEKPNPTAFLTESPFELFASGKYNQVPMIQGITSNEGLLYETEIGAPKPPITPESGVLWYFGLKDDKEKQRKVAKLVEDFYFKNGVTKDDIYRFCSDIHFLHGTVESTKLIRKTSAYPIYLYVYSREGDLSNIMKKINGLPDSVPGVAHGGDQMVIFNSGLIKLFNIDMTGDNKDAAKQIVKLWADFARSGKPHQKWKPVTSPDNLDYLDIDKDLTLKVNPFEERFAFWDKIYKEAGCIDLKLDETDS